MEALFTPLQELLEFAEMKKALSVEHKSVSLTGCVDSQKLHMIYGLSDDFPMKVIVTYIGHLKYPTTLLGINRG